MRFYLWPGLREVRDVFDSWGRCQQEDGFTFIYTRWAVLCFHGGLKRDESNWS